MKGLIFLAVLASITGCASSQKDVYLSCVAGEVEIETISSINSGTEKVDDPESWYFLLRFNIKENTASKGSTKYVIDEGENELRFISEKHSRDDLPAEYIVLNRKDLSYEDRSRSGDYKQDGYTMYTTAKGSCKKVDKPSSPDHQV